MGVSHTTLNFKQSPSGDKHSRLVHAANAECSVCFFFYQPFNVRKNSITPPKHTVTDNASCIMILVGIFPFLFPSLFSQKENIKIIIFFVWYEQQVLQDFSEDLFNNNMVTSRVFFLTVILTIIRLPRWLNHLTLHHTDWLNDCLDYKMYCYCNVVPDKVHLYVFKRKQVVPPTPVSP